MSEVQATISDNKTVISDDRLNIDNYESMTLEERLELLDKTYIKMMRGFFGPNWQSI